MPIGSDHVSKRPLYPGNGNTRDHSWISVNVGAVVEIDELVPECLAKNQPDQTGE